MMPNQPGGPFSGEAPDQKPFWLARSTRTVFFFVVVLTLAWLLPAEPTAWMMAPR